MAIQKAGGRSGFQANSFPVPDHNHLPGQSSGVDRDAEAVHAAAIKIGMIAEDAEEIGEEAATAELIRNRPETPEQDDTEARRRRLRLNELTTPK